MFQWIKDIFQKEIHKTLSNLVSKVSKVLGFNIDSQKESFCVQKFFLVSVLLILVSTIWQICKGETFRAVLSVLGVGALSVAWYFVDTEPVGSIVSFLTKLEKRLKSLAEWCKKNFEKMKTKLMTTDRWTLQMWLYWPVLAALLYAQTAFDTYELCDGFVCCKKPNTWQILNWIEWLAYATLYLAPIVFGFFMAIRVFTFGCCCYNRSVELKTDESGKNIPDNAAGAGEDKPDNAAGKSGKDMPDNAAMRFIFVPLGFFIVTLHCFMVYMRVVDKANIGTPWRVVCCTIAQVWTIYFIVHYFRDASSKYKNLMWNFAKGLMFLMCIRAIFFLLHSTVEIQYFAMNPGCPYFYLTQFNGLLVFIGLMIAFAIFKGSNCFKILITLMLVAAAGIYVAVEPINFCANKNCAPIFPSEVGYGDSIWYMASHYLAKTSKAAGEPKPDVVLVPNHNGSLPLYSIRQTITHIFVTPHEEDNPSNWRVQAFISQALFLFIRRFFVIEDFDRDFTQRQKEVWKDKQLTENIIPRHEYDMKTDDETISHMAFAGFVAQKLEFANSTDKLLAPTNNLIPEFKVDMSYMEPLEHRDGYVPYGSVAYFDVSGTLLFIRYLGETYTKDHEKWEFVKFVFRSTGLTVTTLLDHLIGAHMMTSGNATIESRLNLNTNHPLRRFLKPFTHNSVQVNWDAKDTLFERKAALGRAASLTPGSFDAAVDISSDIVAAENIGARWDLYLKIMEKTNAFSYGADVVDYVNAVHPYADAFVDAYYNSDEELQSDEEVAKMISAQNWHQLDEENKKLPLTKSFLKDSLAFFIFTVTGFHRHVGTVGDFLLDPEIGALKIRNGIVGNTIQGAFQVNSIALATGFPQVKLMTFNPEHLLLDDGHRETLLAAWKEMIKRLHNLEDKIKAENKLRRFKCNSFLPSVQGISIGV